MAIYDVAPAGHSYTSIQPVFDYLFATYGSTPFPEPQIIELYTGTYSEMPTTSNLLAPTATNRLIIRAAAGQSPVLDATGNNYGFYIRCPYVTIDKIDVKGATSYNIVYSSANHSITSNNIVHDAPTASGIGWVGCTSGEAYLNDCYNTDNGIDPFNSTGINIYNNYCHSNLTDGIVVSVGCSSCNVYRNICVLNGVVGIRNLSASSVNIYNNLVLRNTHYGILCQGAIDTQIYNNTIYRSGSDGDIAAGSTSSNITIKNNIIYGQAYAVVVNADSQVGFVSDYNDLYVPGGDIGLWSLTACHTLADWKTCSSGDSNSISKNPLLAGAGTSVNPEDYKLLPLSPCQNIGTDLSTIFTDDFFEKSRNTPWDIGFYEMDTRIRRGKKKAVLFLEDENGKDYIVIL